MCNLLYRFCFSDDGFILYTGRFSTMHAFPKSVIFMNCLFMRRIFLECKSLCSIFFTCKDDIPSQYPYMVFCSLENYLNHLIGSLLRFSPKTHFSKTLSGLKMTKQNKKNGYPDISSKISIFAKFEALFVFLLKDLIATTCCILLVPNVADSDSLPELYSISVCLIVFN